MNCKSNSTSRGNVSAAVAVGGLIAALVWLASMDIPAAPCLAFCLYGGSFFLLYRLTFAWLPGGPVLLRGTWGILLIGCALRIAFLAVPLSDDVNRYAWEGRIVAEHLNPYTQPPSSFAEEGAGDPIYEGINHPDFPAAYPPFVLLIFAAVARFAYTPDISSHATLLAFKALAIIADCLVMLLLVPLLKAWKRPPHWLVLYAWNPLILLYGVGEGHLDVVQNLFLVIALLAFFRLRPWGALGYLGLGCATMTKYFTACLIPFLVRRQNLRWLPLLLLPGMAYLPFCEPGIFHSLSRFAGELHANDLLPRFLRLVFTGWPYTLAMITVLGAGLAAIWLLKQDAPVRAMLLAWGWLICCLPTVHPWYLIPAAILLLHTPLRAGFVLMATMGLQFWILHGQRMTGVWQEYPWLWILTYGPFLAVGIYDFTHHNHPWLPVYPTLHKLDILIPTYNEEENLEAALNSVETAIAQADTSVDITIIMIDGGSSDATLEIARNHSCQVIQAEHLGRGNQFAQGIQEGAGELILMLHADTVMSPKAISSLLNDCHRNPTVQWGILGHIYTQRSLRMRLIEISNRLRFNLCGIAFGDQGIFVRRQVLERAGGMPRVPLMEDVELSLRLADAPYRLQIGSSLQVSTRGWQRKSYIGYTWQVLTLVGSYLVKRRLGYDIHQLCACMYRRYYGREP